MPVNLFGRWELEVKKAIHTWENRSVIANATTGSGTYAAEVGPPFIVDGSNWLLDAQHRPDSNSDWVSSDMQLIASPDTVDIQATIGAEDPLPQEDFEDIEWSAKYLGGSLFDISVRPYAVRINDLGQMPDGLFETALGTYYMGVRVQNQWGMTFTEDHIIDISAASRAQLAARNVHILDNWSQSELSSLGQSLEGNGISLVGLEPGQSRVVFFKIDVQAASPRKHAIDFQLLNVAGMLDPDHPKRTVTKQIFISRSFIDSATGQIVSQVQEGEIRVQLKEVAIDRITAKKRRRLKPKKPRRAGPRTRKAADELRGALTALLEGKDIDPCLVQNILNCYCACPDGTPGSNQPGDELDPGEICDGKFIYKPFLAFPTKLDYTVIPKSPFAGQYGPLPYDDPWWKCLLIIIAVVLLIAGMIAEAADIAYQDEDNVIGTLDRWQQDDVDAAVCMLDTDRALAMRTVLDAQSDEDSQNAVVALNGMVTATGTPMTNAEVSNLLMLPFNDPGRKVFKSGATSGFTHGIISALSTVGHPLSAWTIEQVQIVRDPAFDEPTSQPGDSGSVWLHSSTLRPVGLNHSGSADDSGDSGTASLLDDVQNAMNITI